MLDEGQLYSGLGIHLDPNATVIYVNVDSGNDANSGLTPALAKATYGGGTGALSAIVAGRPTLIIGFDDGTGAATLHVEDPVVIPAGTAVDLTMVKQGLWRWGTPSTATAKGSITAVATGPNAYDLDFTLSAAHNFTVGQGVFFSGVLQQNGSVINGCGIVTASLGANSFRAIVHTQGSSPHISAAGGFVWSAALSVTRPRRFKLLGHDFATSGANTYNGVVISWADQPAGLFGATGSDVLVRGGSFTNAGLGFVGTAQVVTEAAGSDVRVRDVTFFGQNFLGSGNGVVNLGTDSPYLLVTGDLADATYERNRFNVFELGSAVDQVQIGTVLTPLSGELFTRNNWEGTLGFGTLLDAERYANPGGGALTVFRRNQFHDFSGNPHDINGDPVYDQEALDFFGRDQLPTQSDLLKYVFSDGAIWVDPTTSVPDTTFPRGTQEVPVQTLEEAETLADVLGLRKAILQQTGVVATVSTVIANLSVEGRGNVRGSGVSLAAAADVRGCTFEDIAFAALASGAVSSNCTFRGCNFGFGSLNVGSTGNGSRFTRCSFSLVNLTDTGILQWGDLSITDCVVTNLLVLDGDGGATNAFIDVAGDVEFRSFAGTSGAGAYLVNLRGGTLTLDSSVNAANIDITVIGVGTVVDNSTNIGSLDTSGLLPAALQSGAVAAAVWDELRSGHTDAGSFGEALDRRISSLFGGNTRTQLFFSTGTITGGREVPANAVSHMRVDVGDDATPPDFSSPATYYVVFNYAFGDTSSDAAKASSIQAAAPTDGTFTNEPFPPAS